MKSLAILTLIPCAFAAQPSAASPKAAPIREIPWGQLNFLHTTDTHGWHGGHLLEPSFSADWGDYISLAAHLRARADEDGSDLLVIDTGDRVEGNGLYDNSNPKGKYTFDIIKHQQIDVICSGNHELYKAPSADNEYHYTVPNFKNTYLASNLDIYNPKTGKLEALAPRFRKFTTKNQGIRIVAFGFIYNFEQNANNTIIQRVEDTVEEQWFKDAINDRDVDLFLVIGHVAVRSEEFEVIFKTIRKVQWDTPIQFFGGHTHIRDYKKYDSRSYAIESGRFMETIGFMSISGLTTQTSDVQVAKSGPSFGRRYIDNNLFSFHHHTGLNATSFPTELGRNVTSQISHARKEMDLDHRYGCAPKDLWLSRVEVDDENSVFTWLGDEVIYDQFNNSENDSTPKIILLNTGAIRFDIFKGPFTTDTKYQVSPFTSGINYLSDVPYKYAKRLLEVLNSEMPILSDLRPDLDPDLLLPPEQRAYRERGLSELHQTIIIPGIQLPLKDDSSLAPGYTTKDDAGSDGDDTEHSPIKFYRIPNCIQTNVNLPEEDKDVDTVDVYYNAFIEPWVILALQFLGKEYKLTDTSSYLDGRTMTDIIADWVQKNWPCD